jgi:hypothetical protein
VNKSWIGRLLAIGIIVGGIYYSQMVVDVPVMSDSDKVAVVPRPTDTSDTQDSKKLKTALESTSQALSRFPDSENKKPEAKKTDMAHSGQSKSSGLLPKASNKTVLLEISRFDVAEVDDLGNGVFSGRAKPKVRVWLRNSDGILIGETISLEDGTFTILSENPLPEGESVLSLEVEESPGGAIVRAVEQLVISRNGNRPALILVQRDTADYASRILQRPSSRGASGLVNNSKRSSNTPGTKNGQDNENSVKIKITIIDYDEKGRLTVSGEAKPGSKISLDVNGRVMASTTADDAGKWSITTSEGIGNDAIQVGATATNGEEVSTARMPFAPADLVKTFPKGRLVVVQPGNSLWRIARRTYGSGFRYTVIYAANRDQVDNPDLIYPGQILHTPPVK